MTAEIAVFNKTAVALAADSAVTISGGGKHKIYNGAEKLFALTKHHPVGLMVYGSGDLCTAPWELVIKAYRKELGSKCFDTLEEYAEDFFSYLQSAEAVITSGMRDAHLYHFLSETVFGMLVDAFSEDLDPAYLVNFDELQFVTDFTNYCGQLLTRLEEVDYLDGFSSDDEQTALTYTLAVSQRIISQKFNDFAPASITPQLTKVVSDVLAAMICKQSDIGSISGIVIAGYGDKDYYPKVLSYEVCGFFNNKIRKTTNADKCCITPNCGVTPFAQEDEVSAFMQGASSHLIQNLHNEYQSSIINLLDGIDTVITDMVPATDLEGAKEAIVNVVRGTVAECKARIDSFVRENYVDKVVNMIEFLPKQDLAYMAESLVNLTAFKRKVSDDTETVGGPIDVAIISKADGFIWVKRKHYFAKELNHHYFSRS
ncbi:MULTISPECIES: hypothetical protein [Enterobacter cloacae complex]|jgi:hypothetical protein|uniref:hypothetical protein n=1 Tax=Enterobacter cloacae complex TaxID=354276 RepID=UPI0018C1E161|nr:hypothetical protein [Enterobacter roggenkampii]EHN8802005.1 hypothetical protein [Enterobacter asburiae]HCT9401769.1 hypothetical protein [Enterobacter hormaechei]EKS7399047.1 hypothetical protein [Enterobacter roggenkampii]EKY4005594.1 hypothetical protein [Enterobacter roggenkampii]MBG0658263.1 hypothetical protein [Enterobacter roggenkampii]